MAALDQVEDIGKFTNQAQKLPQELVDEVKLEQKEVEQTLESENEGQNYKISSDSSFNIDLSFSENNLSDSSLLKFCSDGRALKGVYFTGNRHDQLSDKHCLIDTPQEIELTGTSVGDHVLKTFSSVDEEADFKRVLEIFGHDMAACADFPFFCNITADISASCKTTSEKSEQKTQKLTYSSTVRSSYIKIRSCTLRRNDIKLCMDAKSKLNELLSITKSHGKSSENAKQECENFFNTYGSHAVVGKISFGGYFLSTCSTTGFEEIQREKVVNIQKNVITSKLGVTWGNTGASIRLGSDKLKDIFQSSDAEHLYACTEYHVQINGGPPEVTDIDEWKKGLVSSNSSWVLIDRGKELMAVWDIIYNKHYEELGELVDVLKKAWETLTGLKAEKNLLALSYQPEMVFKRLQYWNESRATSAKDMLERINFLKTIKEDIISATISTHFWVSKYLLNSEVQQFLISISEFKAGCLLSELIRKEVQQLVQQVELAELDAINFPMIKAFSEWLLAENKIASMNENVADFSSFLEYLKIIVAKVRLPGSNVSPENVAREIEKGIFCLRNTYFEKYEDILIKILVFPFQNDITEGYIHLKPLSAVQLLRLQEKFTMEEGQFLSKNTNKIQFLSYSIQQAMEYPQVDIIFQQICPMLKKLKPPIEQTILNQFDCYLVNPCLRLDFKQWLVSLSDSPKAIVSTSSESNTTESLKHLLLQTPCKLSSNLPTKCQVLDQNNFVSDLLEAIGLAEYFPKKLSLLEALCIRKNILDLLQNSTAPREMHEVPFLLLRKLMSYDSKCLTDLMPLEIKVDGSQDQEDSLPESDNDSLSNSDDENTKVITPLMCDKGHIQVHPIDCLLALITCSDDFLCQDLYLRLAKCQRAIPFLIPNPLTMDLMFPLWSMRSIIQEWKSLTGEKLTEHIHQIVNYPMPIISFLRLGSEEECVSKSKLLNEVISESEESYNYFFHRCCSGGSYKRVLGEGLVDMFWYLPSGKVNLFPDAVAFLNLHGDARNYPKQVEVLSSISSMCFVLVTEKNIKFDNITRSLSSLSDSQGGMVILTSKKQEQIKKMFSSFSVINLKSKTGFEIKENVRKKIKLQFSNFTAVKSITAHLTGSSLVKVDEDFESYKRGHYQAKKIVESLTDYNGSHSSMKDLLPLQGKTFWRQWADLEKELHRQTSRGKQSVQEYGDRIRKKQALVRSQQLKCMNSLKTPTAILLKELLYLEGPENKESRNYFLQCLKLQLNDLSRKNISSVYQRYHTLRIKLASLASDKSNPNEDKLEREKLRKELGILGETIINSSVGLEHLLREIGQLYEAAETEGTYESLSRIPKLVAELLVDGHPLELMDGDAAHVPLKWVSAVLMEAAAILGDPQVFVVSVLGIQSTGKSTMLNTTFGVQFKVSAGRCTRGAYMQLLPLDEEIRKATNCSYVLIVDTEGLRALELDSLKTQKHDNELATFVIGLANVTLINIFGEVPGEMDNILQTSVHAFLRMNKIKYRPSCHFVHQNASVNAKSEVGRENFMAKLNNFTIIAAKEESCEGQYECFNDVIKFDDQTDVHYFPGLWRGDPPMAPVNQGYSTAAQQLNQDIVKCIYNRAGQSDLRLTSFHQKIKDLWEALLNESFIFSFKNTLEIRAYKQMEEAYSEWQWSFKEKASKWEHEAVNLIKSEPEETVSKLKKRLIEESKELVQTEYEFLKKEMDEYFESKDSDLLKDWKGHFEEKLKKLAEAIEEHAQTHCTRLFKSKMEITKFEKDKRQAEDSAGYIKDEVLKHCMLIKQKQERLLECIRKKQLEPKQITELMQKDLFSDEKLAMYEKNEIINSKQANCIKSIVDLCQMTKDSLKSILTGEILGPLDVQKILEAQEQEKELQNIFNEIWKNKTQHLQGVDRYNTDVEGEMEHTLTTFDPGNKGKLQEKLRQCKLSDRKSKQNFIPTEKRHYKSDVGMIKGFINNVVSTFTGSGNPSIESAERATREILHKVYLKLDEITKNETDSIETCTQSLLTCLRNEIKSPSMDIKKGLTFSTEYEIEMQLIVCSHALPMFEDMTKLAQEKLDPLLYLEKHEKGPLFTSFKNLFLQTKTEHAIADTICAYLEEPINERLKQSLPLLLASKMKQSAYHYFSSKMALKVQVLTDLHKEKNFGLYMEYILSPGKCLELFLEDYICQFCDQVSSPETTRLQVIAREEVRRIIHLIVDAVKETKTNKTINWLKELCANKRFRKELVMKKPDEILKACNSSHELDLENFKLKMELNLHTLGDSIQLSFNETYCVEKNKWKELPIEHLKDLIGCTEKCPFCYEQCDLQIPNHDEKHRVGVHRIGCVGGSYFDKTDALTLHHCPNNITLDRVFYKRDGTTHPYKRYMEVYPKWSIPSDKSEESLYWKLFVANYIDSLAGYYNKEKPTIDESWSKITWKKVEEDLKRIYHI